MTTSSSTIGWRGSPLTSAPLSSTREPLGAEGDRLIEAHPLADDRRLADDDAGAVIDEEAAADLGAGMDVDAGRRVRELGDDAGQDGRAELVERMREAVIDDGLHSGKAEQHLLGALR